MDVSSDNIDDFSEGLGVVTAEKKQGYADEKGNVVIPLEFDYAGPFFDGFARVRVGRNNALIDNEGNFIIKPQRMGICFSEGLCAIEVDGYIGFFDSNGSLVIEPKFMDAGQFSEGLCAVKIENKGNTNWAYIDRSGEIVIHQQFDIEESSAFGQPFASIARPFSEGLGAVLVGNKYGYIDRSGKLVISPQFEEARNFREGFAGISFGAKYGFIDRAGIVCIQTKFAIVGDFSEGLAPVAFFYGKAGAWSSFYHWGCINKRGHMVIDPRFDCEPVFSEGLAAVEIGNEKKLDELGYRGFIDRSGEFIIGPSKSIQFDSGFHSVSNAFLGGISRIKLDNKWGYMNKAGDFNDDGIFYRPILPT